MAKSNTRSAGMSLARIVLIAGDALVFLFFAVQGRATHQMSLGDSPIVTALAVAAPFAMSWFIVAALIGAFRPDVISQPGRMLARTIVAWLMAGSIGLVVRAAILQREVALPFAMATLGVVAALLLGWRLAFSLVARRWISTHAHVG